MARKVDAEQDAASKAILDQLQTKTVGAPPSTTGLTGDQLPETIFDVATFDTVKNQVTLQLSNLELLNVLNTIGQVTNTQSQSGPIPGTGKTEEVTQSSNGVTANFFVPQPGHVWQLQALSYFVTGISGTLSFQVTIKQETGTTYSVIVAEKSTTDAADNFGDIDFNPLFIDSNMEIGVTAFGTFTEIDYRAYFIRVR